MKNKKIVIFDLDGTLALIDRRSDLSMVSGKRDWDVFFDPKNIHLDLPNTAVIKIAQILHTQGFKIVIFSGRSKATKDTTIEWLKKWDIPFDILKMRPTSKDEKFMKDSDLKQSWLDNLFPDKDNIFAIFDDRNQVVDMWRRNGLQVFQVADGDF